MLHFIGLCLGLFLLDPIHTRINLGNAALISITFGSKMCVLVENTRFALALRIATTIPGTLPDYCKLFLA